MGTKTQCWLSHAVPAEAQSPRTRLVRRSEQARYRAELGEGHNPAQSLNTLLRKFSKGDVHHHDVVDSTSCTLDRPAAALARFLTV